MDNNLKPTLREAVNNFCLKCQHNDVWAIGNCSNTECELHKVRPNQSLFGKWSEDYDADEVKQEVLDALHFTGLTEMTRV